MMKNSTRNYLRLLVANAILIVVVMALWEFRLQHPAFAVQEKQIQENQVKATLPPSRQYPFDVPASPYLLPDAAFAIGIEGQASNLTALKGQWTVLNLWATWCAGCVVEMPTLSALEKRQETNDLKVIAISLDEATSPEARQTIIQKTGFDVFAQNWDLADAVYMALAPEGLPKTYIIDPQGYVRATVTGERDWASDETKQYLESLMKN